MAYENLDSLNELFRAIVRSYQAVAILRGEDEIADVEPHLVGRHPTQRPACLAVMQFHDLSFLPHRRRRLAKH